MPNKKNSSSKRVLVIALVAILTALTVAVVLLVRGGNDSNNDRSNVNDNSNDGNLLRQEPTVAPATVKIQQTPSLPVSDEYTNNDIQNEQEPLLSKEETSTPTTMPTISPTMSIMPTITPTTAPTQSPTVSPSEIPTMVPSHVPSLQPSFSVMPSDVPSSSPTAMPFVMYDADNNKADNPEGLVFKLKMHWEEDYYWQENENEMFWCLECVTCHSLNFGDEGDGCTEQDYCKENDQIWTRDCRPGRKEGHRFEIQYIWVEDEDYNDFNDQKLTHFNLIKIARMDTKNEPGTTYDLCLERTRKRYVTVQPCDETRLQQQWSPFTFEPFEVRSRFIANDEEAYCMTQQHHPKGYEIVGMKTCENAHYDNSALWGLY